MGDDWLIRMEKKMFFTYLALFVCFSLQQALEHNSFLSAERKIEQGNVEQAFKHVDHIIEGKWSWAGKMKPLKFTLNSVSWFEKY